LRDAVEPLLTVDAPRAGYVVPPAFAGDIAPRLEAHGVRFKRIEQRRDALAGAAFRADQVSFSSAPFEGRMRAQISGSWAGQPVAIQPGSVFVPLEQPLARLVMALLEPQAPDSFAAWGLFNACFEQKEQLEPYVAEKIAAEMLAQNPALRDELNARLRADAGFAASPSDRLEFFLRRHSSWDERYNLYPVCRLDVPP
jgi:hypothetical protein